jgi:hypothetical protein
VTIGNRTPTTASTSGARPSRRYGVVVDRHAPVLRAARSESTNWRRTIVPVEGDAADIAENRAALTFKEVADLFLGAREPLQLFGCQKAPGVRRPVQGGYGWNRAACRKMSDDAPNDGVGDVEALLAHQWPGRQPRSAPENGSPPGARRSMTKGTSVPAWSPGFGPSMQRSSPRWCLRQPDRHDSFL